MVLISPFECQKSHTPSSKSSHEKHIKHILFTLPIEHLNTYKSNKKVLLELPWLFMVCIHRNVNGNHCSKNSNHIHYKQRNYWIHEISFVTTKTQNFCIPTALSSSAVQSYTDIHCMLKTCGKPGKKLSKDMYSIVPQTCQPVTFLSSMLKVTNYDMPSNSYTSTKIL